MRLLGILLMLLPVRALAAATFPLDDAVPGGVAVVLLPSDSQAAPRVEYLGKRIMVLRHSGHWYALVGLGLEEAPGEKTLDMRQTGGAGAAVNFRVAPKSYPTQTLTISNPEMVNPTPQQIQRIDREVKHQDDIMGRWRSVSHPGVSFIWPVNGPETSGFGLRRVLNGEARSPHSGIDIAAPKGTVIRAPASGRVADIHNYFFCGRTLTLDLGQGLYSVYCHMSRVNVKFGQKVRRGQVVGRIGATGRTTGPNLHWTVRLDNVAVDPHVFLGTNSPTPPPTTPPFPATLPIPAAGSAIPAVTRTAPAVITGPARAATHAAPGNVTTAPPIGTTPPAARPPAWLQGP